MGEQKKNKSVTFSFKKSIRSFPGKIFGSPKRSNGKKNDQSRKHRAETELEHHLFKSNFEAGRYNAPRSPPKLKLARKKVLDMGGVSMSNIGKRTDFDSETVVTEETQGTCNSRSTGLWGDQISPLNDIRPVKRCVSPKPSEANEKAARAIAKFEACDHIEAMKLYKSAVRLLHQEEERRDLVIAAVYSAKADVHVALFDWLPAIGLYKNVLKIRLEILPQNDSRIVDVLQKLSYAMEQNDVLGRDSFDSEHFEVDLYDMTNFCSDIRRELNDINDFEEELNYDTAAMTGPIPLDARSLSANSTVDRLFRDFNDQINEL